MHARSPQPQIAQPTKRVDTLGRRSRFRRCPTGKRIMLGERDTKILQYLHRYRYLRQTHLLALMQPKSSKRFVERLGNLFHETGLINRPALQQRYFDAYASPMLYEISAKGIGYLDACGAIPARAVTFSRRVRPTANPQFLHTMMIIDALVCVECTARHDGHRFVPVDEVLVRAPEKTRNAPNPLSVPVTIYPTNEFPQRRSHRDTHIIPDALYGIEYLIEGEKRYRFWALECERTTPATRRSTKASSLALKRAAYAALINSRDYRKHWGIPNLKLRVVTANDATITNIA